VTTEERLAALETHVAQLRDEQAIFQLIASYGPLVDSGCADEVAGLWTTDGVYDVDEMFMGDQQAIHDMVTGDMHQGLIGSGAAHFLGPAHVTVTGDTARAVCHSILLVQHKERWFPVRAGANLFHLVRTDDGWKVRHRTTRALTGSEESRTLLSSGVTGRDLPEGHR
jgi:hypothetical protein